MFFLNFSQNNVAVKSGKVFHVIPIPFRKKKGGGGKNYTSFNINSKFKTEDSITAEI